jgi:hypothetical protein
VSFRDLPPKPEASGLGFAGSSQLVGAAAPGGKGIPAMTVFIYVDTSKRVGDPDHLKVFANADAADAWLEDNDPEGLAFEYEVIGPPA